MPCAGEEGAQEPHGRRGAVRRYGPHPHKPLPLGLQSFFNMVSNDVMWEGLMCVHLLVDGLPGAPNVGGNYEKDAFVQNEIALAALRVATQHLGPGERAIPHNACLCAPL